MLKPAPLSVITASLFLTACASLLTPDLKTEIPELEGGNFKIDPAHSRVIFKVGHLGLAQYVGRFNEFDARLTFDPKKPESTHLQATVNTGSIDINNADLEDSLKGSSWLNVEDFPMAHFSSSSIELTGKTEKDKQKALFCGELTLNNVRKPLCFDAVFNGGGFNLLSGAYTLGFAARAEFKRSDFGIDSFIPAVSDEVELEIHAEFLQMPNTSE